MTRNTGDPGIDRAVAERAEELQQQQEQAGIFAEAVRVTRIPMLVTDPGLPGQPVVFANRAFLRSSGYSLEEVLGQKPHFLASGGAEDARAIEKMAAALAEGRSATVELLCSRKNGTAFPALLFGCPIRGECGRPQHYFSYLDTEQLRAVQRSHSASERQFRLFVEGVSDYAIYMLDPSGRITSWNNGAERIKGYAAEEVLGEHFALFYTDQDQQLGLPQKALQAAEREGKFEAEGRRVRKDGSIFLAHTVFDAIRDDAGGLVGFAKVTRDITERQKVREAHQASEAKSEFLASMSHEIRTPLNGIIGYTERLMEEDLKPHQRRFVERIQTSGSALLTIIDDVLNFSQIEAGRVELEEHAFSLEGLLDNTISIIATSAEIKDLPVRLTVDPGLPKLLVGDEARIRQVLLNLLNNAIKFTEQGEVNLEVRGDGHSGDRQRIRFSVTDTGIGISAEVQHRLFHRFSQVDTSIRRQFGGSGLGLAISRHLVELMGGEIGVESRRHVGSTFWFTIALPQAQPEDVAETVQDVPEFATSARILVVEDLEINQDLVRMMLESAGQQVDMVSNGAEAVAAVQLADYELVLMDIQMPVMDGLKATRTIRALDHPARNVPILAMTANVLPQQVRSFRQAGMNGHIGKPMKRNDLLQRVAEWLPTASAQTEAVAEVTQDSDPLAFDETAFNDLRELVGSERATEWLERLEEQLDESFGYTSFASIDREQLRANAHAIVSQAGSLGFYELANRCRDLEQACISGNDLRSAFDNARTSARGVAAAIPKLSRRAQ